jgi:hypothetical protein
MKYIIKRSSLCYGNKPIEECTEETVHVFCTISGIRKRVPTKVWVADIDNLLSFVDECNDDIIISKPDCEEGYYCLEIYDDYRE